MSRIVAVTGGSSGIGKAAALLFAERGDTVYELSRKGEDFGAVRHITADVCDEGALADAFSEIFEKEGALDVLVCNAGFGISGAVETTAVGDAQKQLDVNFFGVVRSIKQALPYLRLSKRASIINLSSLAAPLSIPFQAFYSSSKAAVNALTLALANELRPFKIAVCAVMPGDVKTGFTDAREKGRDVGGLYAGAADRAVANMEKDERSGMKPERIAKKIYKLSCKRHPKPLCTVGLGYQVLAALAKLLPCRLCNYIVGRLYG